MPKGAAKNTIMSQIKSKTVINSFGNTMGSAMLTANVRGQSGKRIPNRQVVNNPNQHSYKEMRSMINQFY